MLKVIRWGDARLKTLAPIEPILSQKIYKMSQILEKVYADLNKQENKGRGKYGTTLDSDFTELEMLKHAYEETLDTCMYLAKLIKIKEQQIK